MSGIKKAALIVCRDLMFSKDKFDACGITGKRPALPDICGHGSKGFWENWRTSCICSGVIRINRDGVYSILSCQSLSFTLFLRVTRSFLSIHCYFQLRKNAVKKDQDGQEGCSCHCPVSFFQWRYPDSNGNSIFDFWPSGIFPVSGRAWWTRWHLWRSRSSSSEYHLSELEHMVGSFTSSYSPISYQQYPSALRLEMADLDQLSQSWSQSPMA